MLQLSFGITAAECLQKWESAERRARMSLNRRRLRAVKSRRESLFCVNVPELFSHPDEFSERAGLHFVHDASSVDLDRNFGYS